MKISKLRIKNLFGIQEYSAGASNVELRGQNATGKTSVLDAIKLALRNQKNRDYVIKAGESEGEVLIEIDSGISINRKARLGKNDYKSIKQDGKEIQNPEAFLRDLFTELQLNPVEFLGLDSKEQNRIILDLIDFKWDVNWIKEKFGEVVQDVDYNQNILSVLQQIQADDGFYFLTRQDINREARNKTAFIEEIGATLPKEYNASKWDKFNLGEKYKHIETLRSHNSRIEKAKAIIKGHDNKVREFQADKEIAVATLDRQVTAKRSSLNEDIEKLKSQIKAHETELANMEEKKQDRLAVIEQTYKANVAEFETLVKEHAPEADKPLNDVTDLIKEAENIEKMKAFVNEYNRMVGLQKDVEELHVESERYTEKIELARNLPAEILASSNIPIKGLTIKEGKPLINGLPINNLSEGEKLDLCLDVAMEKKNALNLVLIDGMEKLSTENRERLYEKCRAKSIQFIAARTTDDTDLTVVEI